MVKSIDEIKTEILDALNIGIDNNDGSFISSLVGAIATQIVQLDKAVNDVKIQLLPEFADMETLVLLGRKCGLFPLAAIPSQISIEITDEDPKYVEGTVIRFRDSDWSYSVSKHDGDRKYTLECITAGAASNEIPPAWYSSVIIEPDTTGTPEIAAKVLSIQRAGRDPEDINRFRARVMAAHSVSPISANDRWVSAVLLQSTLPIGTVRIKPTKMLNNTTAASVDIYVGGLDYEPASDRVLTACRELLDMNCPIGLEFKLKPAVRLNNQVKLSYTFILDSGKETPALRSFATGVIVAKLREHIRKVVTATPPRDRIALVPNELVGVVIGDSSVMTMILGCKITYAKAVYENETCQFQVGEIPWVTAEQVTFEAKGGGKVDLYSDYPEW